MPEQALIGKTIYNVKTRRMAGRDHYKDIVTWEETVLVFTDGTEFTFAVDDGDTFEPFEYEGFDSNEEPIPVGGGPRPWEA